MVIVWIAAGVLALAAIIAGAYMFWISYSLMAPYRGDPFEHLPEHDRAIAKAKYDYELAEELGYPGEVLLGLESKTTAEQRKAEEWAAENHAVQQQQEPASGQVFVCPTICSLSSEALRRITGVFNTVRVPIVSHAALPEGVAVAKVITIFDCTDLPDAGNKR